MKKNLLTLGVLALSLSANAQVFYAGDQSQVFVSSKALVYSGGDWKVNSNKEKTVENRGNILIEGNYKKGQLSGADTAQDGKEFVNVYTGANDYGQVKLLNTAGTSDARMTVERPAATSGYFDSWFPISLPYKDNANYLMKSFGLAESTFSDGSRYESTVLKWNNNKIQLDPVTRASGLQAGDYYNLNLVNAPNVKDKMVGNVPYKGTPSGLPYSQTANNRAIEGLTTEAFSDLTYNQWQNRTNSYNETYASYMGRANSTSKVLNKNIFRFGNPYTSNLDLSAFDGNNAWVKILNNGNRNLKQAYTDQLIKDFSVTKRMVDYNTKWGLSIEGGVDENTSRKYYTAKFDGQRWAGNAEALLIRPTETFNLNFPVINPTTVGSRVLNIEVRFTDAHKTFEYTPSAKNTTNPGLIGSVFNFDNNPAGMMLAKDVAYNSVQSSDFYQLEIILAKNNEIQASPVYIVGANNYNESGSNATTANSLFVYGVKDGAVAYNSQKEFNEFNSDTYVGKPLGLGLNKLENGQTYQLKFALYEGSIFNSVDAFRNGVFYLKDNATKKITKVSANDTVSFVADANTDKRFEFYWKELPQGETVGTLSTENVIKSQSTVVYRDGKQSKVRFENIANTAKVEVFSVAGTLVSSREGVSTNTDYTLNLVSAGVYIVKVTYQNGEVRTLKVVNN